VRVRPCPVDAVALVSIGNRRYAAGMPFLLHPQLEADSIEVLSLPLSRVRMMNDRTWPWLVLVPAREDTTELFELSEEDRRLFIEEMICSSRTRSTSPRWATR
jgi:diadenosine tetraphosphate (Ap4A) HIT family hydrolase